jgi:hypothetical protein
MHPYVSQYLASERQREMLAYAEQQRVTRRLRADRRASRRAARAQPRVRRALLNILRLRAELEP